VFFALRSVSRSDSKKNPRRGRRGLEFFIPGLVLLHLGFSAMGHGVLVFHGRNRWFQGLTTNQSQCNNFFKFGQFGDVLV
jgi:hypothetical protein